MTEIARKGLAELVGTAILVFFAVGAAVFGLKSGVDDALLPLGIVGVALAFGLVLMALVYAIGPVSGCHVNPAVTLGVLMRKGMSAKEAVVYWLAQLIGGIVGAALIQLVLSVGKVTDTTGAKGTNNWGPSITMGGTFILEIILTFLLVLVVLLVTAKSAAPGFAGIAIGFALTVIHLVGIPLDGTSVNPARSIGPALFQGGEALGHVWVFILAPLIGGAIAALLAPLMIPPVATTPAAPSGGQRDGDRPTKRRR